MTAIIAFLGTIQTHFSKYNFYQALPKVVVTFYLRLRNEFQPFPAKNQAGQPIKRPGYGLNSHFSISDKRGLQLQLILLWIACN